MSLWNHFATDNLKYHLKKNELLHKRCFQDMAEWRGFDLESAGDVDECANYYEPRV
jgi:hypothetical protein